MRSTALSSFQCHNVRYNVSESLQGCVYLLGTGSDHGTEAGISIQKLERDTQGDWVWTRRVLFAGSLIAVYNTGATPVVQAQGRIWRALEVFVRTTLQQTSWYIADQPIEAHILLRCCSKNAWVFCG